MVDLRLLIAAALNSSDLSQSDLQEMAIDRVGALAFADDLGGALWSCKWALRKEGFIRAMDLLSRRCRNLAPKRRLREQLCHTALLEWLDDRCHVCGGRRMLFVTGAPVRPCTVCNATGRRRMSEIWRAEQLGLEPVAAKKWSPKIDIVHQKIADAEGQAWRDIAGQLERRKVTPQPGLRLTLIAAALYSATASVGTITRTPKPAEPSR